MKIGKLRINMIENDSYVDINNAFANVGESVQAVAMEYIFDAIGIPKHDIVKIDQCRIKEYRGDKVIFPLRLPLSKDSVDKYFPLPDSIIPIFMSLHLHDDIFEDRPDMVEYFKKYEPIGCRDEHSCGYFKKHGIEAYMMGCYTLCMPERPESIKGEEIFFVDASEELMSEVPQEMKDKSTKISHAVPFMEYPVTHTEDERLERMAAQYLNRYREKAKLVITSRLHAAAPCMAMGIPVVLASNNADFRYAWIDKFLPIYQLSDFSNIKWKAEKIEIGYVRDLLMAFFKEAVTSGKASRKILRKLDDIYRERKPAQYYKCFRERLEKISENEIYNKSFNYAIWGAGCHGIFAYELMTEMYPEATLTVVVDKFKKGKMFGVPIISKEELLDYNFQHICITTNPGKNEAIKECEKLSANGYKVGYTVITSQQKS